MPNQARHEGASRVVLRSLVLVHAFLLTWLFCPPQAAAQPTSVQRFAVGDHGHLQLNVPPRWLVIVRQATKPGAANTIVFTPRDGVQFELSVTPSWRPTAANARDAENAARA